MPVRDPVAGILSDWFGVEAGSAKVLAALYSAARPQSAATISELASIHERSVKPCISRLRRNGIEIPKTDRWRGVYSLSDKSRRDVREAFAWTAKLLGVDVPDMARIEALEEALGLTVEVPERYRLTAAERPFYGLMSKVAILSKERAFTALYGHRNDPPGFKIFDVMVCKMRPKLAPHGITIETVRGVGYAMRKAA